MSQLEQLKKLTKIVADTGEINQIKKFTPLDATTNPSLIFKATRLKEYQHLVKDAIEYSKKQKNLTKKQHIEEAMDKIYVNFGLEILKLIPGRVSTEIDARLSYDTDATVKRARKIIKLYEKNGIKKDRILVKIATTWEGVRAAEILEKEGIHCNMTLLFSMAQAVICAEANVTLISPFVGRILDWFKNSKGVSSYDSDKDPGVLSVKRIYDYYKKFDYKTVIMGASFRNVGEILELAGIDLLTISPQLLGTLDSSKDKVEQKLSVEKSKKKELKKLSFDEKGFRWALCQNAMATEKLSEGIRKFAADIETLEKELAKNF